MPAPVGNTFNKKWPTSEERKAACERFCEHIAAGYSIESFPDADRKTIRYYAEQFPEDFPPEKLEEAARKSLKEWERIGLEGAKGQIQGFNSASWIFNMKNRAGWRDTKDIEARGIFGGPDDAKKIDKLKPRTSAEIALGVMALLTGQASADDDNATADAD